MDTSFYRETRLLVEAIEFYLFKTKRSQYQPIRWVQQNLYFPLRFLRLGWSERTKPIVALAAFGLTALMLAIWFAASMHDVPRELRSFVFNCLMLLAFGLVVFSVPSVYADHGVTDNDLKYACDYFNEHRLSNATKIDAIQEFSKSFSERAKQRVTRMLWLVGLGWGAVIYFFNKFLDATLAKPDTATHDVSDYALIFLFVLFGFFLVLCYEAASSRLFKIIEFACIECKARLEREEAKATSGA